MRGLRLRATAVSLACLGAWAGCSFKSPRAGDEAPDDAASDDADEPDGAYTPACMNDAAYTPNLATGRRYRIGTASVNYDAAIDFCAASGAHLAVIEDVDENTYLTTKLAGGGEGWIGFDDLTEEGMYRWITGSTSVYNNFAGGEPTNTGNEDCAALRTDGKWHDNGCEGSRRPVCECDPDYRTPPTPPCRSMTANSFEARGRRVFRFTTEATWAQAKTACEVIGAHLLVIGDVAENVDMDAQLNNDGYWIGYTDAVTEGTFRWVNGAMSPYKNWGSGGTVPIDDDADCTLLQDGGTWDDADCDDTNPYACECDPSPP
jgi:hypothetical protein